MEMANGVSAYDVMFYGIAGGACLGGVLIGIASGPVEIGQPVMGETILAFSLLALSGVMAVIGMDKHYSKRLTELESRIGKGSK